MPTGLTMPEPAPPGDPDVWVLIFKGGCSNVPAAVRVRRLLKYALRVLGLRCVHCGDRVPMTPGAIPDGRDMQPQKEKSPG